MEQNEINDIEVHNFVDLSPSKETMMAIEIKNAKELLRSEGYFVDSLWQTCDITLNYHCTEEQAQKVLDRAFRNESVIEQVWMAIGYETESMNLKHSRR